MRNYKFCKFACCANFDINVMARLCGPRTNKKRKISSECLCHKDGVNEVSWKRFKKAVSIQNDCIAIQISRKWEDGPFGSYHRKLYQSYPAKNSYNVWIKEER